MLTAKALLVLLLIAVVVAAAASTVVQRGTSALQAPRVSLDMATAGTAYDEASNTMVLGPIENCLTTAPAGNNARHVHIVHLVLQDAADVVGWQVRFNYDGGLMRPSTVNYSPFADNARGQNVSFVNLPIDSATGVHRDLVTASDIPPAAAGPQSALAGGVYLGEQSFAISPDTPPKAAPDDTSYSAPSGGVLAAVALQVPPGLAGQPLLTMDLDDGNPNFPGTDLQVFTGSGITTVSLPEGSLSDGFHAEGPVCVPPAGIPPVPADDPGVPDPAPGETPGAPGGGTAVPGGTSPGVSPGAGATGSPGASRTATTTPTPNGDDSSDNDGDQSSNGDDGGSSLWLLVVIAIVALLVAGGAFAAWRYRSRIPWLRDRFPQ